jgi:uncharacterized membrane protein YbaN (DUF454 family)
MVLTIRWELSPAGQRVIQNILAHFDINFSYVISLKVQMKKNKNIKGELRRYLLIIIGTFFLGLGIIGIFLPLLPTTPFLLLAAACYTRSSKRFYNWLLTNRWLGNYIRNYRERKGVPFKIKILSISFLWIAIGYSVIFVVHILLGRIILILIATGVTIHILCIQTLKR